MSVAEGGAQPFRVQAVEYLRAMAELHSIRETVFVREQRVPAELERDALDAACLHVVARTLQGDAIGTGRLVPPGAGQPAKVGRMAVLPGWRGRGVGSAMLLALLRLARQRGWHEVALHAQATAIDFYLHHDFIPQGPRFMEAGIEHQAMHRTMAGPMAVATTEEAVATVAGLVVAARRALCLRLRGLDPGLMDAPAVLDAMRAFGTAGLGGQARILLLEAMPPRRTQAPLLELAQRLPSVFLFRELADPVDREDGSAWIANDVGGYYRRPLGDRIAGEADFNAPGRTRQLRAEFERTWARSRPVTEYRALGI
ncbi:MAG TPA: GNAT family N-acetyltransferase [Ramlibacter sp.]